MSYQEERLQEIADAIREVKGTTEKIPATSFASEIVGLSVVKPNLITKEVTENGTYKASDDGADGYSEVVVNVASSGGGGANRVYGEFRCVAIDYDGTVLKEEWLNEGDVFELPEFPTHDRLIAQEWSSPAPISDNKITVWEGDVIAGLLYDTQSGLSEFDVCMTKSTGKTITFNMSGTKDWGDGTSDNLTTHTYANYGNYTITCDGTSVSGNSSNTCSMFGAEKYQYNQCVAVRLSSKITSLGTYTFYQCRALQKISFPNTVTSMSGGYWFEYCGAIKAIVLPKRITTIGTHAFRYMGACENIVMPQGLRSIGTYALQSNARMDMFIQPDTLTSISAYNTATPFRSLRFSNGLTAISNIGNYDGNYGLRGRIAIPPTITSCGSSCYLGGWSNVVLDFSKHTEIPTMDAISFLAINTDLRDLSNQTKIIVPDNLYDEWRATTNWSKFSSYIYKASEV